MQIKHNFVKKNYFTQLNRKKPNNFAKLFLINVQRLQMNRSNLK
jgi:hypothetical protein